MVSHALLLDHAEAHYVTEYLPAQEKERKDFSFLYLSALI